MIAFEDVIQQLGQELDAILHVDEKGVCCIELNDVIQVQIEPGPNNSQLLICAKVCEIPPGKFREQALYDYLRANHFEHRKYGTFSFLPKRNLLFFHEIYWLEGFHPENLVEFLTQFSERALSFRKAIQSGRSAPFGELEEIEDNGQPHKIETGIKS